MPKAAYNNFIIVLFDHTNIYPIQTLFSFCVVTLEAKSGCFFVEVSEISKFLLK